MAEGKKKSSKMTWNRLKNDASIQKNELVRIAKAFGITPPKGWKDTKTREKGGPTGRERSRTAGGYKAPARKKAADKEPAAISATRQKAVAPKAKKAAAQKEPAAISSKRQRAVAPKAKARVGQGPDVGTRARRALLRGGPDVAPERKKRTYGGAAVRGVKGAAKGAAKKVKGAAGSWRRLSPKGRMW
jgi:hypothetical protein